MVNSSEPKLIEERFGELFDAARMLLRKKVTEEERTIPTLAFANDVQLLWSLAAEKKRLLAANGDPKAWEREAEMFAWKHASLRPVQVVNGILLLERVPVYVYVHNPVYVGEWEVKPTAREYARVLWDTDVVLAVYPHPRPISPAYVADLYRKTLSAIGVSFETSRQSRVGSMREEHRENHLLIIVEHGDKTLPAGHRGAGTRKPVFPHPDRIGYYYKSLMGKPSEGGFASYLITRQRGPAPEPEGLISASVAFYLSTRVQGRKEIHKLINEHVLRESWKRLPEGGYSSSETNQLWRDAEKFGKRLLAASHPLYFSQPEWLTSHNSFSPKNLF